MINDEGGINGRKINLISLDDGYSPPKTVEQVRKLVEQDEVLACSRRWARRSNIGDPQVRQRQEGAAPVLATGATKWNDPKNFPWTLGFNPSYQAEGEIYARYLLKNKPEREDRASSTRTTTTARTCSRA